MPGASRKNKFDRSSAAAAEPAAAARRNSARPCSASRGSPRAIDLHVGKGAHCIAVALVDFETECCGDLYLVGRYVGALVAQPVQLESRRNMALLCGLAVPTGRPPLIAPYPIAALQQPCDSVLRFAVAGERPGQRPVGVL